jgi:hypothetical protein
MALCIQDPAHDALSIPLFGSTLAVWKRLSQLYGCHLNIRVDLVEA